MNSRRWFLRTVAAYGLTSQTAAEGATGIPRVPLPAGGREALELLNEGVGAHSGLGELVESLERQSGQPARLTRLRRVAPMAMSAIPLVFGVFFMIMVATMLARFPELMDLSQMDRYESALADMSDDGEFSSEVEEAIYVILAAAYVKAEENPSLYAQALSPEQRALLDSAVARYPAPTPEQVAGARDVAAVAVPPLFGGQGILERISTGVSFGALTLGFFSIVATILAFILRGSLLFHAFGIQVQTLRGERPHRLRCAARSLVAWFPLLAVALLTPLPTTSVAVAIIAMMFGAVYAIVFPTRGIADRVVGTVLVPK